MSFRHGVARNIGAALGLFAMLVVTLLAPVHQAHAAQRDLARAHGELQAALVICHGDGLSQADSPTDIDGDTVIAKCPICSLAKQIGAMPVPELASRPMVWAEPHLPSLSTVIEAAPTPKRTAQPRAPPILV